MPSCPMFLVTTAGPCPKPNTRSAWTPAVFLILVSCVVTSASFGPYISLATICMPYLPATARVSFFRGHAVGMRGLEHPFLDRLDDHHRSGKRDERDLCLFDHRHHGHGRSSG